MKPIVLMTAGREDTQKKILQFHAFQNYGSCAMTGGCIPLLACMEQKDGLEQLADIAQGLFLTGGEDVDPSFFGQEKSSFCGRTDPWRDETELRLCELFIQRKKPIFGICRGLQVLNVYFKGTLVQDMPHDWGIEHPNHSIHDVEAVEGSWLYRTFGPAFQTNSYHHQAIDKLGEGLKITASSVGGRVAEGIEHEQLPILAVQWHPERMVGPVRYDPEGPDMTPYFAYLAEKCREQL